MDVPNIGISGSEIKYRCPFHVHTGKQKHNASMNIDSGNWNCYNGSCGALGNNILTFISKFFKISFGKSKNWLKKTLNYDFDDSIFDDSIKTEKQKNQNIDLPDTYTPIINRGWIKEYIEYNNFNFNVLQMLEVGIDLEKINNNFKYFGTFLLPFSENGEYKGYCYKFLKGKYRYIRNFQKKKFLYGYDQAIMKTDTIVVEGPRDVWRLKGFGENPIAISGSYPSGIQIAKIIRHWKRVVICTDNDIAGNSARDRLINELKDLVDLEIMTLPPGKDPCDISDKSEWMKIERVPVYEFLERIE